MSIAPTGSRPLGHFGTNGALGPADLKDWVGDRLPIKSSLMIGPYGRSDLGEAGRCATRNAGACWPAVTTLQSTRKAAETIGMSGQRITQAHVILDHAPALADSVLSKAMGFDEAYEEAKTNEQTTNSNEAQLAVAR